MFISKKRLKEIVESREMEVKKDYEERFRRGEEQRYREDRDREMNWNLRKLEDRMIEVEKKCGIDHPSHHKDSNRLF